jgi:putative hydrolase
MLASLAVGQPPVAELLAVDGEYRRKAKAAKLPQIAPRKLNPRHAAWLPILHTDRDGRKYTVLFSNTERAHRMGRTHDWVVLYYDEDGHERQCTVVTEFRPPLAGRRVVRGRERECAEYYGVALEPEGEVLWFW